MNDCNQIESDKKLMESEESEEPLQPNRIEGQFNDNINNKTNQSNNEKRNRLFNRKKGIENTNRQIPCTKFFLKKSTMCSIKTYKL